MRSMWRGAISFGLVNIPVRLYVATEDRDLHFNLIHVPCGTPIRNQRICPRCNAVAGPEELAKGFAYDRGQYVLLTDEDLESVRVKSTHTIEITDFIHLSEIDPIFYAKSYYIEPSEGAAKAYRLLRQALVETEKVAVARVTLRSKEALCAVRVYGPALALETMFFPDELRPVQQLNLGEEVVVSERELTLAKALIDQLSAPFDPNKYTDSYRAAAMALIERKVAGRTDLTQITTEPAAMSVSDLLAALEASLRTREPAPGRSESTGVGVGVGRDRSHETN